ncbi:MAG TPA: AraC family transcriptional regulator [Dongiaceae bacterium]|nr:AraC family transcriptional regulator [Dongiaceae bacterium]
MSATATPDEFEPFRFSSEDLRPADRIPFYRDLMDRMTVRMDFESLDERFICEAHGYRLSDLSMYYVAGSAVRAGWRGLTIEGGGGLALVMSLEGASTVSQRGREVTISAGNSNLHSVADPMRVERTAGRIAIIGMPHAMLAPMLSNPDAALMSVIPSTIEPLRLLAGYVDLLIKDPALLATAELRRLAVSHVHDLVAVSIGATRDAAAIAAGRGLRAARLRAIKADIARNHAGDVTATALSARHRLTPRYIRKLFESEDMSLSQFVRDQRLTRVHRMLADPRYAHRAIGDIALAAGFGDISTFNREFRRRFGMRPSDVRRAAFGAVT